MPATRARSMPVIALAIAAAVAMPSRARAADAGCEKLYDLAKPAEATDLATKLLAFTGSGLLLMVELAEPKMVRVTGNALLTAGTAIELSGVLRSYFGTTQPVHACPGRAGQPAVVGTDVGIVRALALGAPLPGTEGGLARIAPGPDLGTSSHDLAAAYALLRGRPSTPPAAPPASASPAHPPSVSPFLSFNDLPAVKLPGLLGNTDALRAILFDALVSGRITDAATGHGVPTVVIRLDETGTSLALDQETTTAADGSFSFQGLAAGTYRLSTHLDGYSDAQRMLDLPMHSKLAGQDLALNRPGYPCAVSLSNQTHRPVVLWVDLADGPHLSAILAPAQSSVLSRVTHPWDATAQSPASGPRWSHVVIGCGGGNSVTFTEPN